MPWWFLLLLAGTTIGGWIAGGYCGRWFVARWIRRQEAAQARRRAELEALARARATITRACEARSYAAKARN